MWVSQPGVTGQLKRQGVHMCSKTVRGCSMPSSIVNACLLNCSVVSDSCDSMDWGLPGSSVHGIFPARILEWVAIPFSRGSPPHPRPPGIKSVSLMSPALAGGFFTTEPPGNPLSITLALSQMQEMLLR
ncbi:unnamed protein product [Rangifer tarandus platyrhynchus]|uniref:Uncharacterized protein n=2 Tax=Rangifer tarandus platyrhynchus TaxID=3082113 RepID=A0ABN8ZCD4_RANTA|nr:unnamed protein product [Rangifer tarandus platyrhynchus]